MPGIGIAAVADGNVREKRFVKFSGVDNRFVEAGAGDPIAGVSGQGTRNPPYSTLNDGFLAIQGEEFKLFTVGEVVPVVAGAAVVAGNRVKADASARAIPVAADKEQYGGVALQNASGAGVEFLIRIETGMTSQ